MTAAAIKKPPANEVANDNGVVPVIRVAATPVIAQVVAMSVFINVLALGVPVFVIQVYDRVIPHAGFETLFGLAIGVVVLILFDFILRQARARALQRVALRIEVDVTKRLFDRFVGLPLAKLEERSDSAWRMVLRDVDTVRDFAGGPMAALLIDLPFVALFITVVAFVALPIAWVLLALIPIYLTLALLSSVAISRCSMAEQQSGTKRAALTEELVAGRADLKALGLGSALRMRCEVAQADVIRQAIRRAAQVDFFNHIGASMAFLTTIAITSVGAVAIILSQMSIGGLIAANLLAARIVQPLVQMINLWRGVARFRDAATRIDAVLCQQLEHLHPHLELPRPLGELVLENIAFSYPRAKEPILRSISARFASGSATGVVGGNGGGKSTMLKVLQGLYTPENGRVLLDGSDVNQFARSQLESWIGYVPQEPFLFSGSIRDNIARGRDIDDATVLRAADAALATGFISDLPDGFGTEIGESGRRLSPGLRQRIALARALVLDPPVLLLDEPSANLDMNAEQALCEELDTLKLDRTVVIVSHSTQLLHACDVVMVLSEGRIVMVGQSDDVLPRQLNIPRQTALKRGVA